MLLPNSTDRNDLSLKRCINAEMSVSLCGSAKEMALRGIHLDPPATSQIFEPLAHSSAHGAEP